MRFILFFLLFLAPLGAICQSTLKLSWKSSSGACDNQLKNYVLLNVTDSVATRVNTWTDTACVSSRVVDLQLGKYVLRVFNEEQLAVDYPFSVKSTAEQIAFTEMSFTAKTNELEEVTITGVPKKFIVRDAEKTTVTVENNPIMEISSVYDAILKIPGILPYPGGGFAMGGQQASVYFDGIPSSLGTTDLENLLKSLPATTVKTIELIANPGASYDANVSGAIIDIISQGRVSKWISGTVSLNAGFNRNAKVSPSFNLNGKGKKYTWQIQTGYALYERDNTSSGTRTYRLFNDSTSLNSYRRDFSNSQNAYFRPSITYRFNKNSFLQASLGATYFKHGSNGYGTSEVPTVGVPVLKTFNVMDGSGRQLEGNVRYRTYLDTLKRKMEWTANYSNYEYTTNRLTTQDFTNRTYSLYQTITQFNRLFIRNDYEIPFPKLKSQLNVGAKFSYFDVNNAGNYRLNDTTELTLNSETFASSLPFHYIESNTSLYTEWKQRIGNKFSITAGLRAEDFRLNGKIIDSTIVTRHYFNVFPSVHTMYRIADPIVFTASYSRKVQMPNYSQFDPNLSGYYDNYTTSTGNSQLSPNYNHRAHANLSIFDYLEVSVDYTLSNSINLNEAAADSNSYTINYTYKTYENVSSLSYYFAVPLPFGMFTKGLKFFNEPVDIDAISFLYVYANRNSTFIPNYVYLSENRPWWTLGCYSQFILPGKVRMNVEYNYTAKGMFNLTETTKDIHDIEVTFSREFKDERWRLSASVQDLLNMNTNYSRTAYSPIISTNYYKADTRQFWFKIAYSFGRYERPKLNEGGIPVGGNNTGN